MIAQITFSTALETSGTAEDSRSTRVSVDIEDAKSTEIQSNQTAVDLVPDDRLHVDKVLHGPLERRPTIRDSSNHARSIGLGDTISVDREQSESIANLGDYSNEELLSLLDGCDSSDVLNAVTRTLALTLAPRCDDSNPDPDRDSRCGDSRSEWKWLRRTF